MDSTSAENIVLYDYLSFTSKRHMPEELIEVLGLGQCPWSVIRGARGYQDRKYFSCISIHYNGRADMGVWVEMTGQGCRTFETLSTVGWECLFQFIRGNGLNITRMDVAYDDHTGILDINSIAFDTMKQNYISKSNWYKVEISSEGISSYVGSPKSKVRVRMYDKAAERKKFGEHWVRCELQLRDERAIKFNELNLPIGQAFTGVLLNYLRYVEPSSDTNKWRWPMKAYWRNLVEDAERISIYQAPGMEYNEEAIKHYVVNQAGNAVDACIRMYGIESFQEMIANRDIARNPHYDQVVQKHFHQQEKALSSSEAK